MDHATQSHPEQGIQGLMVLRAVDCSFPAVQACLPRSHRPTPLPGTLRLFFLSPNFPRLYTGRKGAAGAARASWEPVMDLVNFPNGALGLGVYSRVKGACVCVYMC